MKRSIASLVGILLLALCAATSVQALDVPHTQACTVCHVTHRNLGTTGTNNVCQACHALGQSAGSKAFLVPSDMANPYGSTAGLPAMGTKSSHNWSSPDINAAAGAVPPSSSYMSNPTSLVGKVTCNRCHAIHASSTDPNRSRPYLRMINDNDEMCLDCHRPRNTADHTKGTHPVGVDYAAKAAARPSEFYATPQNSNPANPSAAMKIKNGKVLCLTCHGVHYADSNSRTFDNRTSARMGLLSTSRGFLLRTDMRGATVTARNICTNCHKSADDPANTSARVKNHNGNKSQNIQCTDCHGGHVDTGDGTAQNIYLINRFMNISTQYGAVRNAKVMFLYSSSSQKNYNKDAFGVCVACHSPLPSAVPEHAGADATVCNSCHTHAAGFSAKCDTCHGYPPQQNVAGGPNGYAKAGSYDYSTKGFFKNEATTPHLVHAGGGSNYSYSCYECHKGNSHNTGSFQDVFLSAAGTIASTGGATPAYNTAMPGTCSTTYCHSDGNGVYKTPTWSGTKGTIVGQPGECGACHAVTPATNAHSRHLVGGASGKSYLCVNCHSATVNAVPSIIDSSKHVNGSKDVLFSGSLGANTLSGSSCSAVYCHSNGKGVYSTPVWGTAASGQCGTCHATSAINTNGHTAHLSATYGPAFNGQGLPNSCQNCHTYTTELAATHVNGTVDYTSASCTTNCHKNGLPTWNNSRLACESCHTGTLSVINGLTAPAKNNFTGSGHGQAGASYNASRTCDTCHDPNSAHISMALGTYKRIAVNDNTLCASCHNDPAKVPTTTKQSVPSHVTTYQNGIGNMDCKVCHDVHGTTYTKMVRSQVVYGIYSTVSGLNYNGTVFIQTSAPYRGLCQGCHTKTAHFRRGQNETNHPTTNCLSCHQHKAAFAFKPKACNECHGYPPVPASELAGMGTLSNYTGARVEDYANGGGVHARAGHIKPNARPSEGWANCTVCHGNGSMGPNTHVISVPSPFKPVQTDITVDVDDAYKFNSTLPLGPAQYSGPLNGTNTTGSCSNVSCHFRPSPVWSP